MHSAVHFKTLPLCAAHRVIACRCDRFAFAGAAGSVRMYNLLRLLCRDIPTDIGGIKVRLVRDYVRLQEFDLCTMTHAPFHGTSSQNVTLYLCCGIITLCPDSTQPHICMHITAFGKDTDDAKQNLLHLRRAMRIWIMQRC